MRPVGPVRQLVLRRLDAIMAFSIVMILAMDTVRWLWPNPVTQGAAIAGLSIATPTLFWARARYHLSIAITLSVLAALLQAICLALTSSPNLR